jgi:hypothetical protein
VLIQSRQYVYSHLRENKTIDYISTINYLFKLNFAELDKVIFIFTENINEKCLSLKSTIDIIDLKKQIELRAANMFSATPKKHDISLQKTCFPQQRKKNRSHLANNCQRRLCFATPLEFEWESSRRAALYIRLEYSAKLVDNSPTCHLM